MDILSHGLWGSLAFGRKSRRSFFVAFFFGVAPDLFSFGFFFIAAFLGLADHSSFAAGPPPADTIPGYVHALYPVTHSFVVFALAFLMVWLMRRRPVWEMAGWALHILYDIPFHEESFFPTPFLWPFSSYTFNGWPWSSPWIFFPNVATLVILSLWIFIRHTHAAREI